MALIMLRQSIYDFQDNLRSHKYRFKATNKQNGSQRLNIRFPMEISLFRFKKIEIVIYKYILLIAIFRQLPKCSNFQLRKGFLFFRPDDGYYYVIF